MSEIVTRSIVSPAPCAPSGESALWGDGRICTAGQRLLPFPPACARGCARKLVVDALGESLDGAMGQKSETPQPQTRPLVCPGYIPDQFLAKNTSA